MSSQSPHSPETSVESVVDASLPPTHPAKSDAVTDTDTSSTTSEDDLSTREASFGEVWKFSIPLIISQASMSLLGLVDTFFMGMIGPEAQSAVGFGGPSVFAILSLFFGLFSGLTTFVSQYFGAKRHKDCGKMLWQMLYLALGIGLLCTLSIAPLVHWLLVVMGTNAEIFDGTYAYMHIRMLVCPIMFTAFTLLSFLRGIGDMKTPAIVSIITVLINIPLTYVFAFGFGPIPAYGVAGAAIGTVISQGIEMLLYASVVFNRKNAEQFGTRKPVLFFRKNDVTRADANIEETPSSARYALPIPQGYAKIARIALPVGICWAIENYGWLLYGLYITTLPKEQSAANAIVQIFMYVAWMPGLAISIATTALVGQYIGANNVRSAEKSANYAIIMSIGCLVTLSVILFLLRYPIAHLFSNDPAVIDITVKLFYFAIVYQVFDAAGVTTSGALRGAGDTRFPMLICFLSIWGIMIPLMFYLDHAYQFGIYGAWVASSFAIIVCGCLYYARFKRGKWKKMKIA
ncbi:MAG: MATE family efflux transporter [Proteobacteria bacterium]|nr:MATE family efflux transporter [Pseudomonadota bacterium]